ncbi:signal peptidase I [Kitasatospora nipponensis]
MGTRGRSGGPGPSAAAPRGGPLLDEPAGGPGGEGAGRGRAERRRTAKRAARKGRRSLLREVPLIAVVALLIALTLKTFFVQVFVIPSGSMEQTIRIGDRVLVDKLTPWFGSEPQRGDVVVFKDPGGWLENEPHSTGDGPLAKGFKQVFSYVGLLPSENEQDLIKRVVGVGGDTVACCDDRGRITVNGKPIEEPYLAPGNPPSRSPFQVTVPPGRLWVMGDHRDLSADSRYHMDKPGQGTVPLSDVVGRAFLIGWPLDRFQWLDRPTTTATTAATTATTATSAAALLPADPGEEPQSVDFRPDPLEPSLVMGVLGVSPALLRRWYGTRPAGPPPARRRWRAARRGAGAD